MSQNDINLLIPKLSQVKAGLGEDFNPEYTDFTAVELFLEQLPYDLNAAHKAISDLKGYANEIAEYPDTKKLNPGEILGLSQDDRDIAAIYIDNYLGAARKSQNSLLHYISKAMHISVPSSLSDLMKKTNKEGNTLPDDISAVLSDYWRISGKQLKAYRDLSEHHALVASDCRLYKVDTNSLLLYMALPNNPEEKSAKRLKYEEPIVHAIPYVINNFRDLCRMVNQIMEILSQKIDHDGRNVITTIFKGPLTLGPKAEFSGHRIPISKQSIAQEKFLWKIK